MLTQKKEICIIKAMQRFGRLNFVFLIVLLCATFAHTRSTTLAAYFEQMGSHTQQLRAVDSTPPAIPALKETEETEKSRIVLEEFFLSLIMCAIFLPKKLWQTVTRHVHHARTVLSKYRKAIVSLQTVK